MLTRSQNQEPGTRHTSRHAMNILSTYSHIAKKSILVRSMVRYRRRCTAFFSVLALGSYFATCTPPAFSHQANSSTCSIWQTQLANTIEAIRSDANLPSIGFALVVGNTPVFTGAVGQANIAKNISATADTPYLMASVSKTFVATALMQMIEEAKADDNDDGGGTGISSLNVPVNDHLPWKLDNPRVVDDDNENVIRISHLVSHTSGICDRWIWGDGPGKPDSLYFPGDSPITLDEILRGYFLPGGKWYNASGNFQPNRPGQNYEYANFNGDLAGYLVETVTGVQLRDYSQNKLFLPLGMTNSGWRLADFAEPSLVAMPYYGTKKSYGQFGYPDYPSGMLRCSPADIAEYMAVMLGAGENRRGVRVLQTSSVNTSFADVFKETHPNQGVFWYSRGEAYYGEPNIGHSGSDYGTDTEMWLLLKSRVGIAVMINQDGDAVDTAIQKVLLLLVDAGRRVALYMGACCRPDGTCATQTQKECLAHNGNYQGNQADCLATTCPATQAAA